ncbi:MAG: DNA-protecting protein DprA [Polyangiaceae bacterium]|nr:DNA-protecting protein DprA [Polyangiaceae bacterium]
MNVRTLTPLDAEYPKPLGALGDRPTLRVRGTLREGPTVAIVGSRKASEAALAYARFLAANLASHGIAVWSGGALGIDTSAHQGALDAEGHTVVVLGSGHTRPYPAANIGLFDRVVAHQGAVVSLYDDDAEPIRQRFLRRNRALAACADLVVIVECDLRSGARNTANHAHQLGKRVAVVLQPPWSGYGLGCIEELESHNATPIRNEEQVRMIVEAEWEMRRASDASLDAVARELRPMPRQLGFADFGLADEERALVEAVRRGATDIDGLCNVLARPPSVVSAQVIELVLRGAIEQTHRGLRLASTRVPLQSPAPRLPSNTDEQS